MKTSIKILKFNCYFTSLMMLLCSLFELIIRYFSINNFSYNYNKFFIYIILCYLLFNFIVFSVVLLKYKIIQKRNSKIYITNSQKGITISKVDIFNFISLFVYWFANPGLLSHPISSSAYIKLGLLNYFLIFVLINIVDEFEEMKNIIE